MNDLNGHLASDQVVEIGVEFVGSPVPENEYAIIHYNRPAGDYGDHTTGNANDFWGLHLWGDAIDPAEATELDHPKPFLGEDEYGRFAFVQLADDTRPVNFIVHRGDTKDPDGSPDRSFDPAVTPEIWLRQGDPTIYPSQAAAQGHATVHYACTACSAVRRRRRALRVRYRRGADVDDYGAVFTLSAPGPVGPDHGRRSPTAAPSTSPARRSRRPRRRPPGSNPANRSCTTPAARPRTTPRSTTGGPPATTAHTSRLQRGLGLHVWTGGSPTEWTLPCRRWARTCSGSSSGSPSSTAPTGSPTSSTKATPRTFLPAFAFVHVVSWCDAIARTGPRFRPAAGLTAVAGSWAAARPIRST